MNEETEASTTAIDRIGILGAGRAGTALARVAAAEGIQVQIAASRPPRMLKYHLLQYAPQATAVEAAQIAQNVDLVVLMVPQEELDDVDPESLAGVTLVDATNRWVAEELPEWFEKALARGASSSEALAQRFTASRVVKALNHMSHWDMDSFGRRSATPRRALAVASDHPVDAQQVAALIERLGYDPVVLNSLADGVALEPDGQIFNQQLGADQLRATLMRDAPEPK